MSPDSLGSSSRPAEALQRELVSVSHVFEVLAVLAIRVRSVRGLAVNSFFFYRLMVTVLYSGSMCFPFGFWPPSFVRVSPSSCVLFGVACLLVFVLFTSCDCCVRLLVHGVAILRFTIKVTALDSMTWSASFIFSCALVEPLCHLC